MASNPPSTALGGTYSSVYNKLGVRNTRTARLRQQLIKYWFHSWLQLSGETGRRTWFGCRNVFNTKMNRFFKYESKLTRFDRLVTVISRWINAQINIRKRIDLRKIVFQSDINLLAVTGRVFKGDVWKFFCKINEMKVKKRKCAHLRTITSRINERFKQQKKQLRQITGNLDDKIPRRQTRSAGVEKMFVLSATCWQLLLTVVLKICLQL